MKTEQEIMQMVDTCDVYHSCALCPYNPEDLSRYIGNKWKGGCPNCDRKLVYAMGKGYGDISEYKAEIERLKAEKTQLQIDTINTIIKYCENPNHWNELKNCKLWGGKSDDLRDFLNRIFKENNDENTWIL